MKNFYTYPTQFMTVGDELYIADIISNMSINTTLMYQFGSASPLHNDTNNLPVICGILYIERLSDYNIVKLYHIATTGFFNVYIANYNYSTSTISCWYELTKTEV